LKKKLEIAQIWIFRYRLGGDRVHKIKKRITRIRESAVTNRTSLELGWGGEHSKDGGNGRSLKRRKERGRESHRRAYDPSTLKMLPERINKLNPVAVR